MTTPDEKYFSDDNKVMFRGHLDDAPTVIAVAKERGWATAIVHALRATVE